MEFDESKRNFFRRSTKKIAQTIISEVDNHTEVAHCLQRPPFALEEVEFLLNCTRCNACVDSCPHQAIRSCNNTNNILLKDTPIMDLENTSCQVCADWPCVIACPTLAISNLNSLIKNEISGKYYPRLALVEIDTDRCLPYLGPECGACEGSCPIDMALYFAKERPIIDSKQCIGCGLCRQACVLDPSAINLTALKDYPIDPDHRK